MDRAPQDRLDTVLAGATGRPFARDQVRAIEAALGHAVPAPVDHLWSRFGGGTIPSRCHVILYDADEVIDLLEQYADAGLAGLLPLASNNGSRDFAVDLVGRDGAPPGTILLNDRTVMNEGSLRPVAADFLDLFERALADRLELDGG